MTTIDSKSPMSASPSQVDIDSDVPSSKSASATVTGNNEAYIKSREADNTKIIQVANIAPQAIREQMYTLFSHLGKIDDIRLYPTMDLGMNISSKICFVKFYDSLSVGTAQHLTNTVFIDRALVVVPYIEGDIPDEEKSLEILFSGTVLPGIADPKLPQHVTSQLEGVAPNQVVITTDPTLDFQKLPSYPPLPPSYETRKIEEIRRTVLVANVDSELGHQNMIDYFSQAGEVKYFRFCTRDNDPLHYALIEFTDQPSIIDAIRLNGTKLGSKIIKVYHASQSIIKPQAKTNEAAKKEIEEAMSRQTQNMLSIGLDGDKWSGKDNRRSRSRSVRRSRSKIRRIRRSRTRSRSRSRPKSHRRSRSRSRVSKRRSPSSSRNRSREYLRAHRSKPKKSRSRSRSRTRRSSRSKRRSKSRRRSRKSRSRSLSHSKKSESKSRKKEDKKLKHEEKKKNKRDKEVDKKGKGGKKGDESDDKENDSKHEDEDSTAESASQKD